MNKDHFIYKNSKIQYSDIVSVSNKFQTIIINTKKEKIKITSENYKEIIEVFNKKEPRIRGSFFYPFLFLHFAFKIIVFWHHRKECYWNYH